MAELMFVQSLSYVLAFQGTFKSLLQPHNLKVLILHHSTFFMVQLSHLYMITGTTITLTSWTFVGKRMPFLFNTLSMFERGYTNMCITD